MNILLLIKNLAKILYRYLLSARKKHKSTHHHPQPETHELQQPQKKRKTFPLLRLPLDLRIQIYNHTISNDQLNITQHNWRNGGRVLPPLFHTSPQITYEIYKFCPITAIIDINIPNRLDRMQHQRRWMVIAGLKHLHYDIVFSYHARRTMDRMVMANKEVERFRSVEGRREMAVKVRVKCLGCRGSRGTCTGLSGELVCAECLRFSRSPYWTYGGSPPVRREDMLFEFC
jgi:hypothetical protein